MALGRSATSPTPRSPSRPCPEPSASITGTGALKTASLSPDERELSKLGGQGWEVVASYLELETAYPNFGDAKYVTGLQPNIRPQRLVLLLRHRIG